MQIVLADDDRFSRESLLRTLQERTGHTITAVSDGDLALECAVSQNPDALILDWMMPTMTGTEVCRRIRSADVARQPYVLVATGKNQREDPRTRRDVNGQAGVPASFSTSEPIVAWRLLVPIRPLPVGTSLVMSGYPWRMPFKISDNAAVRSHHASGHVVANLDAFRGNSGAGVFHAGNKELLGILVRGDADFVLEGDCHGWKRCDNDACRGEDVMYVHHALQHACTVIDADFCP